MAGFDSEKDECQFYVMDYLASMVQTKYAAHGYGGFFTTALIDSKYRDGESTDRGPILDNGLAIIKGLPKYQTSAKSRLIRIQTRAFVYKNVFIYILNSLA